MTEASTFTDEQEQVAAQTQRVSVNLHHVKQLLRHDPEFFIHFFLGESVTVEVPEFHKEVFSEMTHADIDRLVMAIPRGTAKTTLAKLCCVWYLLFSDYRFILYVSGSHDLVVPYVNDVAAFFTTDNFRAVFGDVDWLIHQDGKGIYKFRIPSLNKTCILRGLGSGQRVRGVNVDNERPQLAVCDDIEDDEDVETDSAHEKMRRWWFGPFVKCLNPVKNKIVVCGNLLSNRSVLYKLLKSNRWRSFLYGIIKADGTSLWPDIWPMDAIRADFIDYQENGMVSRWFAEMMNQPVAEGGGLIKGEEICYKPERTPEEIEYGFITIDPALSHESWADNCAIGAHGWVAEEMQWQTVEEFHQRGIDPADIFWKAIDMAQTWGFRVIGVESGSMQQALEHYFRHLQLTNNLQQYKFVSVKNFNRSKNQRLSAWAAMLKEKQSADGVTRPAQWAITEGDFIITQQLLNYKPNERDNDDDVIDMCGHALLLIDQHLDEVMQTLPHVVKGHVASTYTISQV